MIDTHAHLDFPQYVKDLDDVIKRAEKAGVEKIIIVGIDLASSKNAIDLAKKYNNIYAAVSIHPIHAKHLILDPLIFQKIRTLTSEKKVVAIGEAGLDYFHIKSDDEKISKEKEKIRGDKGEIGKVKGAISDEEGLQRAIFCELLALAKEKEKPIIIHVREADEDMIKILKKFWDSSMKGVVHCFGRDWKIAKEYLDLGLYLSFTGNITYGLTPERKEMISKVPLNRMMLETDCPFMTPQAQRQQGIKRNEPAFLPEIAKMIAKIKNDDVEKIDDATARNAEEFFKLKFEAP